MQVRMDTMFFDIFHIDAHNPVSCHELEKYHELKPMSWTWTNVMNLNQYHELEPISWTWTNIMNLNQCHELEPMSWTWTNVMKLNQCHELDQRSYISDEGSNTRSQNLCVEGHFLLLTWILITLHTVAVHKLFVYHDHDPRSYQGHSAIMVKLLLPWAFCQVWIVSSSQRVYEMENENYRNVTKQSLECKMYVLL